jgi:hypothetical protein
MFEEIGVPEYMAVTLFCIVVIGLRLFWRSLAFLGKLLVGTVSVLMVVLLAALVLV